MNHIVSIFLLITTTTAFAGPIYKVDLAAQKADLIVLGEVYKVEMTDDKGNIVTELRTHATKRNHYKIKNYVRVVENLYGTPLAKNEFIIERPLPAYYGKESLRQGLKMFYFLNKDGTPIKGKYEFDPDRRHRILNVVKTRA